VGGAIGDGFTTVVDGKEFRNWTGIWLSGAVLCAGCVVALAAFFPSGQPTERSN
jgi:hypothetical protein